MFCDRWSSLRLGTQPNQGNVNAPPGTIKSQVDTTSTSFLSQNVDYRVVWEES